MVVVFVVVLFVLGKHIEIGLARFRMVITVHAHALFSNDFQPFCSDSLNTNPTHYFHLTLKIILC